MRIQSQPRLQRVRRWPWVSEKSSFKGILHFREDCIVWRTFSFRKWRVNSFKGDHSFQEFEDDHKFQRRLHFREDWVLWRMFSIGKWRVNVFKCDHAFQEFEDDHKFQRRVHFREDFISEKIGYSGEHFRWGNEEWMYSKPTTPSKSSKTTTSFREDFISEKASFQRRLHFREDWVLWRTFSIGKWRVNVFKGDHAFQEFEDDHKFQRRLHFREDWVLWRTFSIEKWIGNVFKANHAFQEFEDEHKSEKTSFQRRLLFREDFILEKIGYSGERFRSENEEWMFSKATTPSKSSKMTTSFRVEFISEKTSFQRRLVSWRTFSIGKWRVNVFKDNHAFQEFEDDYEFQRRLHFREGFFSEKIGYSGECFQSGNEEWMFSKATTPPKSSKTTTGFREDFILEKIGYSGERFRSGNEEWMFSKVTTPSKSSKTTTGFREEFISEKTGYSGERFRSGNEEWLLSKATTPSKSLKTATGFSEDFISEKIGYFGEGFQLGNEEWMFSNILRDLTWKTRILGEISV